MPKTIQAHLIRIPLEKNKTAILPRFLPVSKQHIMKVEKLKHFAQEKKLNATLATGLLTL